MDDFQLQLQQAKRSDIQALNLESGFEPKWLATMPNVYAITQPFSRLMAQLPAVKATKNSQVISTFLCQLVSEITKLYAYRIQIIQLSDTISDNDKPRAVDDCLAEGHEYITQLGALLSYDSE